MFEAYVFQKLVTLLDVKGWFLWRVLKLMFSTYPIEILMITSTLLSWKQFFRPNSYWRDNKWFWWKWWLYRYYYVSSSWRMHDCLLTVLQTKKASWNAFWWWRKRNG